MHEYQPKSFVAFYTAKPKKITVKWLSNNSNRKENRGHHLKTFSRKGKPSTTLYLVINTCQLVDDLLSALTKFISSVRKDSIAKRNCARRINEIADVTPVSVLKMSAANKAVVEDQMLDAWKNRAGVIDARNIFVREK